MGEKENNRELANEILKHLAECKGCQQTVISCMHLHGMINANHLRGEKK